MRRRGFTRTEAIYGICGLIILGSVALVLWEEHKREVMEEQSRVLRAQNEEYVRRYYIWFNATQRELGPGATHWVLHYVLPNEEAGLAYVEAHKKAVNETGEPPTGNIQLESPITLEYGAGNVPATISNLRRLEQGRLLIYGGRGRYDLPRADIPVFIERPSHQGDGSNVLFLDGRVKFMPYPGAWPMTEKFIKALESLDELTGND